MALLSGFDQLNAANSTFSDWLNKTNELILLVRGDTISGQTSIVTANSQPGGSMTYGNATLFGQFTANTMVVINDGGNDGTDDNTFANANFGGLRGGVWDNVSNTITADTLYIVSNTTFTDESTEVYVNSTYGLIVENNIEARYDVLYIGDGPAGSNTNAQLHWQSSNNQLNFNDDVRATFGGASGTEVFGGTGQYEMFYSAADNRMYSNTDIQDIRSTANLNLITDTYELRTETGNELIMTANVNNGVELYWNDQLKFSTNAYGVVIHGDAYVRDDVIINDNQKLLFGDTYPNSSNVETIAVHNLQIYTDGTDGWIVSGTRDLLIEVDEGFELRNEGNTIKHLTANTDGYNEVTLFAGGTKRLETIDSSVNPASVDGVEIYGEANTNTLRVQSDANFDNTTLNSNSVHWDATNEIWNYRDNVKATWGDGDDLEVYYTGTRGNVNTDILDIRGSTNTNIFADDLEIKASNGEFYMTANINNGVELYWDNTKKVSTNTHGVEVYGQVLANNGFVTYNNQKLEMGGANYAATHNLELWTDGTDSWLTETGNGDLYIQANNLILEATDGTNYFVATSGANTTIHHGDGTQILEISTIGFNANGEANTTTLRVRSDAQFEDGSGNDKINWEATNGILNFEDDIEVTFGSNDDFRIYHDSANNVSYIKESGLGDFVLQANNMQLEDTSGQAYFCGTAGLGASVHYNGDQKLITTNIGIDITGEANTDTLRVQSTTLLEDDVFFDGTVADQMHWDASLDTLHLKDDVNLYLGTGKDFHIYHDSATNRSFIKESGTGDFVLQANNIQIENTDGESYFCGIAGQGASLHYNSDQKLITRADGIEANGIVDTDTLLVTSYANFEADVYFDGTTADAMHWESTNNTLNFNDGVKATFGDGDDLEIYHDGTHSYIRDTGTGRLYATTNEFRITNAAGSETILNATAGGSVSLYNANSLKLATTAAGIDVTGLVLADSLQVDGNVDLGASNLHSISVLAEFDTNLISSNQANVGSSDLPWDWGYFNDINVANTATILNLEVTSLEANGVALTGTGGDVTSTSPTEIDNIDLQSLNKTQGFKYFVHGKNILDPDSGYAVEINVIITDNDDIYYTRYGEVESNMSDVSLVPSLAANTTHVILNATCDSANTTHIHRFNVMKIETRDN